MVRIGLITIITSRLPEMKEFYSDVMGFECIEDMGNYVEFRNEGVRFALTTLQVMYEGTERDTYNEEVKGHPFELAFPCGSPEDVGKEYDRIVGMGAEPVMAPEMMP